MVNKKVLIFTGVLLAGAVLVLGIDAIRARKGKEPDARVGQPILDGTKVASIDRIELSRGDVVSATLVRGDDSVWHLKDGQGFPVDPSKVLRLLDDLGRTQLQTVLADGKESLEEFGLTSPSAVVLKAKAEEVLKVELGDSRKGGGQYVAIGSVPRVYLAAQAITASSDEDAWEMKTLLNIAKEDVKAASFQPADALGKKPAALTREKKEDQLQPSGLAAGAKASPSAASTDSSFASLTFSKRYDPSNEEAKSALSKPSHVQVTLFDGRAYDLWVGSVGDKTKKYFLRIKADAGTATLTPEQSTQLAWLNDAMEKFAFEVPSYIGQRFEKGAADFIAADTTSKG